MSNLNIQRYMDGKKISQEELKNIVVEKDSLLSILSKTKNRIEDERKI